MRNTIRMPKVVRQLTAAAGYLELSMPRHALGELDAISDAGPLTCVLDYFRGEALKEEQKWDEAATVLQRAATMIPAPANKRVWISLAECLVLLGREEEADLIVEFASTLPDVPLIIPIGLADETTDMTTATGEDQETFGEEDSAENDGLPEFPNAE